MSYDQVSVGYQDTILHIYPHNVNLSPSIITSLTCEILFFNTGDSTVLINFNFVHNNLQVSAFQYSFFLSISEFEFFSRAATSTWAFFSFKYCLLKPRLPGFLLESNQLRIGKIPDKPMSQIFMEFTIKPFLTVAFLGFCIKCVLKYDY